MTEVRDAPNRDLLDELALAFAEDPEVAIASMFRSPGLRVGGKVFAFLGFDGELIVKLPRERSLQLIDEGAAAPVTMGERTMREWIELAPKGDPDATLTFWGPLAQEAYRYVNALRDTS